MNSKSSKKGTVPAAFMPKQSKRPKVSKAGKSVEPVQTTDVDITAQNAVNSPLLRLPAELRNSIWGFCYGGMMVTVDHFHFLLNVPHTRLQFRSYDSVPSDQEHVDLVGEGFESLADKPKLVCKQFWVESSQVFFATATFNFTSPTIFMGLTVSPRSWLQHVRRLRVTVAGSVSYRFLHLWAHSLVPSRFGHFTHLEGVEFRVGANHHVLLLMGLDIMTDHEWEKTALPFIIRSFQQHKLKPELTRFICEEPKLDIRGRQKNPLADEFGEAIRAELLKHHPRPQGL